MADIQIGLQEIAETLPELWKANPQAQMQFLNIILQKRLTQAQAEIERLRASPNGAVKQEVKAEVG